MAEEQVRNSYTEEIPLVIKIERKTKEVFETFNQGLSNLHSPNNLKKSLDSFRSGLLKNNSDLNEIVGSFSKGFSNGILELRNILLERFGELIADSLAELSDILESSQLSNAETRGLAFQYGFTASEAYAFQKALDAVGLRDEEDLWYASDLEQTEFAEAFENFSSRYDQLYDQGFFEQLQEYQYEMNSFKEEMKLEVVQFMMNNKDLIKSAMKGILSIVTFIGKIASVLTGSGHQMQVSEALAGYGYTKTTNTSLTIDNTFNGVQSTDRAALTNAGSQTFMQIIAALKGGQI